MFIDDSDELGTPPVEEGGEETPVGKLDPVIGGTTGVNEMPEGFALGSIVLPP